jgi:hypothetical protein
MPIVTAEPGIAEPGSAEPGSTLSVTGPTIIIRRPWLGVTIGGIEQTAITDAACHFGFDQRYATAEVNLRTVTGGLDLTYWLPIEISMGASALTAVPRFAGYILPIDNKSWVPGGTLHCRGPLGVAATFGNWDQTEQVADSAYGTDFRELATPSDQEIANAILTYYGLGSHYVYTGGGIGDTVGGTGVLLGTTTDPTKDFEPLLWKRGQTGLDFLDQLDQQCVATDLTQPVGKKYGLYKTFETVGGFGTPNIFRTLVTANPQLAAGAADFAFAEGVDLLRDLTVTHDPTQVVNAVRVVGYDDGTGPNAYPEDPTIYLSANSPYLPVWMPNGPDGYPISNSRWASAGRAAKRATALPARTRPANCLKNSITKLSPCGLRPIGKTCLVRHRQSTSIVR